MQGTNLARLEDIGGCRAVLQDGEELRRVLRRMRRRWNDTIVRNRDYVTAPKAIGYRPVHLVVERDGRRIEVQLRTRGQQSWADAIETADTRLGMNLKDGEGPDLMVRYFAAAGELIYQREYGLPPTADLLTEFRAARAAVIEAGYYRA